MHKIMDELRNSAAVEVNIKRDSQIVTKDTMSDAEFNKMMKTGLEQARAGKSFPLDEAFNSIQKRI